MVAAACVAVLGVEALSALDAIRRSTLIGLALLSLFAFWRVTWTRLRAAAPPTDAEPAPRFLIACLLAIGAVTLIVALRAAPNTWDSMSYHLARVAQWYDHGNVRHYVTGINRQLWQPPFAEYLVLVGYGALGGRDWLAAIPQWLGGCGAVIAAMEIARLLGATRRTRYVVALFTAGAPIVILQATSTNTDLLAACWIAITAWLALAEYTNPGLIPRGALWIGAALGLAIGTKGTSIPLGLPWLVVLLLPSLKPLRARAALTRLAAAGLIVLVLVGGHFVRNLATFDNPLGPATVQRLLRPASIAPPAVFSNLLAHLSLQLGTPSPAVNEALAGGIAGLHSALGIDLSTLYPYFGGFRIIAWTTQEDSAGNPVIVLLGVLALVVLIAAWRRTTAAERVAAAGFLAGVVLFAITVRWQPFNARLHAPIIVLLAPCLLLPLVRIWPRVARVGLALALVLAVPPLLLNAGRPILPPAIAGWSWVPGRGIFADSREAQYFASSPELYDPYRRTVDAIARLECRRVALKTGYDSREYPLWVLGRRHRLAFEHYSSDPRSSSATVRPCALIALDQPAGWRPAHVRPGTTPLLASGPVTVWP